MLTIEDSSGFRQIVQPCRKCYALVSMADEQDHMEWHDDRERLVYGLTGEAIDRHIDTYHRDYPEDY